MTLRSRLPEIRILLLNMSEMCGENLFLSPLSIPLHSIMVHWKVVESSFWPRNACISKNKNCLDLTPELIVKNSRKNRKKIVIWRATS